MKKASFLVLFHVITFCVFAQIGGKTSFNFLALSNNARIAAIGGENISSLSKDINSFLYNPAILHDSLQGDLSINYSPFYADISRTDLAYLLPTKKFGTIGLGLAYMDYGTMTQRNIAGQEEGTFHPREYAFIASKSHKINHFSMGASVKLAGSHIEEYTAFSVLADIGGVFKHPTKDFSVAMLFKNVGWVFDNYQKGIQTLTPFDIQLGLSYKLTHLPLRLSLTAHHLNRPDIQYIDSAIHQKFNSDGEIETEDKKISEQIARHLVIGGELLLSKNFHLRVGYNHQRRKEMITTQKTGKAGFSFGGMVRIKSFEFGYTRAFYYAAQGVSMITLTTNINQKFKRKQKINTES